MAASSPSDPEGRSTAGAQAVPDPERLPIDPTTGRPLPPHAQPGYYPGFSTLSQQKFWDEATRTVVLERVQRVPPIRFFTGHEVPLMRAVCERIMPQDDRDDEHRIPVLNYIDERLYSGRTDGYRYEDMLPDGEAHKLGLRAIDEIARHLYGRGFVELGCVDQEKVLETVHNGNPPAGHEVWGRMSITHYWALLMQDAIESYYCHPYAWDEIGFGGPAYPRGYMRQENGLPEPWEVDEQRYPWAPPPLLVSGIDTTPAWQHVHPHKDRPAFGQEGTH